MADKILHRRPCSGFVKYPSDFEKRIVDGDARFRTRCDMLVGPCACGRTHQEGDGFVRELLERYNAKIEEKPLTLAEDGKVYMPRYWRAPRGHEGCNVLSGQCNCGLVHTANQQWVVELLEKHCTKIIGCPESELPIIDDPVIPDTDIDTDIDIDEPCGCPLCQPSQPSQPRQCTDPYPPPYPWLSY